MNDPSSEARRRLLKECEVQRSVGGGPGGQHRNRTESCIVLIHRPTGLRVRCDEERSQHRNLRLALDRLAEQLEDRRKVRRPRVVSRKRPPRVQRKILDEKKKRGELKRGRRSPRPGDE